MPGDGPEHEQVDMVIVDELDNGAVGHAVAIDDVDRNRGFGFNPFAARDLRVQRCFGFGSNPYVVFPGYAVARNGAPETVQGEFDHVEDMRLRTSQVAQANSDAHDLVAQRGEVAGNKDVSWE
jgi:hypothetical protein